MSDTALRRVRIYAPPGASPAETLRALDETAYELRKALKAPLAPTERARARKAFLRLQKRFGEQVRAIYETMDDVAQTGRVLVSEGGLNAGGKEALDGLLDRQHRRAIAQLNAQFSQAYDQAFELGLRAGGAARGMDESELQIVRRQRLNENAYAGNFLTDIAHAEGTMPYGRRAAMYVKALEETYWQGYLYADLSSDRYVRWVMQTEAGFTEPDHCIDCARLSGNLPMLAEFGIGDQEAAKLSAGGRWGKGVYQARELAEMGIAPQSGKLSCTTHCKCHLEPAKRPEEKPTQRRIKQFRSLVPKEFTGTRRGEKGGVVVERQAKRDRRTRYARKARRTEHQHLGRRG